MQQPELIPRPHRSLLTRGERISVRPRNDTCSGIGDVRIHRRSSGVGILTGCGLGCSPPFVQKSRSYNWRMATRVIHISEAEAARNFDAVLAQVRSGAEIIIEQNARPIAIIRSAIPALDWSECDLVESDPSRLSGRPVLKGTRMPADDVLANYESGVSVAEISEQFGVESRMIRELLTYAERRHALARPVR